MALIGVLLVDNALASKKPFYAELFLQIEITHQQVLYWVEMSDYYFCETVAKTFSVDELEKALQQEDERILTRTKQVFHESNPVEIDGLPVQPVVENINLDTKGMLPAVQIRLSYPVKAIPNQVKMSWTIYPKEDLRGWPLLPELVATLKVQNATEEIVFTEQEPDFTWLREDGPRYSEMLVASIASPRKQVFVPVWSVFLVGLWAAVILLFRARTGVRARVIFTIALLAAAAISARSTVTVEIPRSHRVLEVDPQKARIIFETLHGNIYRAFDYATESDIYDALAHSIDGSLLEETYNDVYASLLRKGDGGAICRIQSVRVLDHRIMNLDDNSSFDSSGFRVWCQWRVHGFIRHWGHTHARTNEYEAVYTIAPREGTWKIIATEVMNQERVT